MRDSVVRRVLTVGSGSNRLMRASLAAYVVVVIASSLLNHLL